MDQRIKKQPIPPAEDQSYYALVPIEPGVYARYPATEFMKLLIGLPAIFIDIQIYENNPSNPRIPPISRP